MREIKFRAWHKGFKKMFSAEEMAKDQLTILPTGNFINVNSMHTSLSVIIYDMVPMQYIGLNDKNLKDVYEGDIIRLYVGHPSAVRELYKVVFEIGAFQLSCIRKPWLPYCAFITLLTQVAENIEGFDSDQFNTCFEVVGNIYENPELIQKEVQP